MRYLLLALLLLLPIAPVAAQERILSYDSEVEVRADGSLDVTERIVVRAEGDNIRRGIYRDFPTRYRDRYGNRVVVDLQVLDVQRDGMPEPWFTEPRANGVRINTGNDDFLPTPAVFAYTLHYRTTRQLGFFDTHDELYWNAIGTGWDFPIESGSVQVRLPQPVPVQQMRVEAYTGAQGQRGDAYRAEATAPGIAQWMLTQPLAPSEGMTVVLGFPKGIVTAPTGLQRAQWLLKDNRGVLIALTGLIVLLVFCLLRWRQVGRDPQAGTIIVRYEPPAGYTPAGLRFMQNMTYDNRCFSADILALAVGGWLRIHRGERSRFGGWRLEKASAGRDGLGAEQKGLYAQLFAGATSLELDSENASFIAAARFAHAKALNMRFMPAMFKRNGGSVGISILIMLASIATAIVLGGGTGFAIILLLGLVMLAITGIFARLVRAPTLAGRALLDEIEGFKRYLTVAERDDLKRLVGPADAPPRLDGTRYEALLPYAVALEVEDAWTRKFTDEAGAAAVARVRSDISWYRGGSIGDLSSFSTAIGSGLTAQIASSSVAPGSSSSSSDSGGGGGFSGGGGGGGGGGGR